MAVARTLAAQLPAQVDVRPTPAPIMYAPLVAGFLTFTLIFASHGSAFALALALLLITCIWAALRSISAGLVALLTVSCLDGLIKGVHTSWMTLLLKDIVLFACLARWAFNWALGYRPEVFRHRLYILITLFVLWVFGQLANTTTVSIPVALAGVRCWTIWLFIFVVAYDGLRTREDIYRFWTAATIAAVATGLYGVYQYQNGFDHLLRVAPGLTGLVQRFALAGGRVRAMSTLPHPGIFGHFMGCILPVAVALALQLRRPLCFIAVPAAVAAVAAGALSSGGRLAAASSVIGLLCLGLVVRRFTSFSLVAGMFALIFYAVGTTLAPEALHRIQSMMGVRIIIWRTWGTFKQGIWAALNAPLGDGVASGVGVGRASALLGERMRLAETASGMHWFIENEFGRAFQELGIPGGLLFMLLVFTALGYTLAGAIRLRGMPQDSLLSAGIFACTVAVASGLATGSALYLMPMPLLFWAGTASNMRLAALCAAGREAAAAQA